jgi:TRAP-type uncharacterized transport system fused permease subunit
VALAAFAGAGIAGANPMRTGYTAMRLGWILFFIPFYFVYLPPILIVGSQPLDILWVLAVAVLSLLCISCVLQNWLFRLLSHWERIALVAAGAGLFLGLVHESLLTSTIAFTLAILVYLNQRGLLRKMVQWLPTSSKRK